MFTLRHTCPAGECVPTHLPPPEPNPALVSLAAPAAAPAHLQPWERLRSTWMQVSNVPGHLNSDELKQRMRAHPGCFYPTLMWRPKFNGLGTVEFQVEFSDRELANQCQSSLMGRPFLESHPECGDVVIHVRTVYRRAAPVRPLAPPATTTATFDIGPRPSSDVRSHVFVCVWHCVVDLIVSLAADACESAAAA